MIYVANYKWTNLCSYIKMTLWQLTRSDEESQITHSKNTLEEADQV